MVPPLSTSRVMVSSVRPAWEPSSLVAWTRLLSTAVSISTSLSSMKPPYCFTVALTTPMDSFWPSGVTPSVRGVRALGRGSNFRNWMVLPPPWGMLCFWPNWSWTSSGSAWSMR